MDHFTIKELERISGIKAHTIRTWEQRYRLLQPGRTDTNIRLYNGNQLRKLLNVVTLQREGLKISHLASYSEKEVQDTISTIFQNNNKVKTHIEFFINDLTAALLELNEAYFEKAFSTCVLRLGFFETMVQVIYPLLKKIGILWCTNEISPAHEHFAVNVIRQKLFVSIDAIPLQDASADTYLLFLPEEEDHDIGLLFAHYLLKRSGKKVIFLGSRVPFDILPMVARMTNPQYLFTFFVVNRLVDDSQEYIDRLSSTFPERKILVSGSLDLMSQLSYKKNVVWLKSIESFIKAI